MIPLSRKDKDLAPVPPLRKLLLSIYKNSEIRLKRFVKREPKAAEMVVCAGSGLFTHFFLPAICVEFYIYIFLIFLFSKFFQLLEALPKIFLKVSETKIPHF